VPNDPTGKVDKKNQEYEQVKGKLSKSKKKIVNKIKERKRQFFRRNNPNTEF